MERVTVNAGAIKALGYDPETLTLEVEFAQSGVYRFLNVAEKRWKALLAAEDKEAYFTDEIKDHHRNQRQRRR